MSDDAHRYNSTNVFGNNCNDYSEITLLAQNSKSRQLSKHNFNVLAYDVFCSIHEIDFYKHTAPTLKRNKLEHTINQFLRAMLFGYILILRMSFFEKRVWCANLSYYRKLLARGLDNNIQNMCLELRLKISGPAYPRKVSFQLLRVQRRQCRAQIIWIADVDASDQCCWADSTRFR